MQAQASLCGSWSMEIRVDLLPASATREIVSRPDGLSRVLVEPAHELGDRHNDVVADRHDADGRSNISGPTIAADTQRATGILDAQRQPWHGAKPQIGYRFAGHRSRLIVRICDSSDASSSASASSASGTSHARLASNARSRRFDWAFDTRRSYSD